MINQETKQKVAHSPLPWSRSCFLIKSAKGDHVTHTGMGNLPPSRSSESEANAEFIFRAANSHYALIKALGYVAEVIPPANYRDRDDSDQVQITVTVGWLREVAEALASAREISQ